MFTHQNVLKETSPGNVKMRWMLPLLVLLLVVAADQALKYWVKHNMVMHTEMKVFGNWFLFHFTENNGMAFGIEFGGTWGKLLLTMFRILVSIFGAWYLFTSIKKGMKLGFLVCVSLILAGAVGNIIDCVFYGEWYKHMNIYEAGYFHGRVVDMLYFPIIETHYPSWFPNINLGSFQIHPGDTFVFFSPVFNLADAAISTGVIALIVFQKRYFVNNNSTEENDKQSQQDTEISS